MVKFWPQSNEKAKSQTVPGEDKLKGLDVLFAHLRRLERRTTEVESKVSTNRRDINRIDRKGYREAEAKELEPHPVAAVQKSPYPDALFR